MSNQGDKSDVPDHSRYLSDPEHRLSEDQTFVPDSSESGEEEEEEEEEDEEDDDEEDEEDEEGGEDEDVGGLQGEADHDEESSMNPAEQLAALERLIESMKDCSEVMEFKHTQSVKKILEGRYPDNAYREAAATRLRRTIESQQKPLVADHHKHTYRRYASLSSRLDAVNNAFKLSKDIVKQELDPLYGDKLSDNPDKELQQKRANRNLNERRNIHLKIGKEILNKQEKAAKALLRRDNDSEDSDGGNDKETSTTPAKKTTPLKRRTPNDAATSSKKKPRMASKSKQQNKIEVSTLTQSRRRMSTQQRAVGQARDIVATAEALGDPFVSLPSGLSTAPSSDRNYIPEPPTIHDDVLEPYYSHLTTADLEARLSGVHGRHYSLGMTFELSRRYRQIICRLLGVGPHNYLTLGMHRLYARAYFEPTNGDRWYHRSLPAQFAMGFGFLAYYTDGVTKDHIANVLPIFRDIAIERHDIAENGDWFPMYRPVSNTLTEEEQRALGLIDNPLDEGLKNLGRPGLLAQDPR